MVILKLLLVIAVLLVLIFKKVNMALSLAISSVLLVLINGQGVTALWTAVKATAVDQTTWTMALTILFIGILSYLMNQYKMLDRMVMYLEKLVRSTKVTIMLAPSLMGLLLVTGGALMSCPVVDTLGERLNLPGPKRAAINLIFRHGLYFIYPLSSTLILASQLGGFELYELVRIQFPVSLVMYLLGYLLLLRGVPDVKAPKLSRKQFSESLWGFLVNAMPIIATIVITVIGLEFYISLIIGIAVAIVIHFIEVSKNAEYRLEQSTLTLIVKGINVNMVLIILSVLLFKSCIEGITAINAYILQMVGQGVPLELVIIVICLLVTFPTSNINPALGIGFPFITAVATSSGQLMLYSYLLYACGFLCYYASPLHMCQVFSLEYFKASLGQLMKEYRIFMPALAAFVAAWYFVLRVVLL